MHSWHTLIEICWGDTMVEMQILKSHEEWLKSRTRIGGSDAAAIVGLNPWLSNQELYDIKTGAIEQRDISNAPAVKYGTEAEPLIRELFKLDYPQYKVDYVENNLWLNSKYPFGHASMDGWLTDSQGRRGIWECKTTEIMGAAMAAKWKGKIPDNYYCQVLHYLLITEFDFAVLHAQMKYTRQDGSVTTVRKSFHIEREDVLDDIAFLADAEKKFWDNVQNHNRPALILPEI